MSEARYETLEALQRQAAASLDLPVEHERVQTLAALRLAHRLLVERMVNGSASEAPNLLALGEAITKLTPVQHMPEIKLKIVSGVVGIYTSKHCGQRNELPDGEYQPPSKRERDYPRRLDLDAEVVKPDAKAHYRHRQQIRGPLNLRLAFTPAASTINPVCRSSGTTNLGAFMGGHPSRRQQCLLLVVKRTSLRRAEMSAYC